MTVAQIQSLALALTGTKSGQVGTADLLTWFNIARKRVGSVIMKDVDENYFFQIWKRDAVAAQTNGEYPYPEADNDSAGMVKCLNVAIKGYSTDLYYQIAREVKLADLEYDWEWYLANQAKSNPIYFIGDESIFIAPQFAAADVGASGNVQIKLTGLAKLTDLTAEGAATTILIPDDHQHVIAMCMMPFILRSRGKKSEADSEENNARIALEDMCDSLTNRDHSNQQATLPNDSALQTG